MNEPDLTPYKDNSKFPVIALPVECDWCGEKGNPEQGGIRDYGDKGKMHAGCAWSSEHGGLKTQLGKGDEQYKLVEEIQLPGDVKLHIMASDDEVLMVFEGAAVVAILGNAQNAPRTNTLLTLNVAKTDNRTTARPIDPSYN